MKNIRETPDMKNNDVYSFYVDKYRDKTDDDEIFYLSGINYVYNCLDQLFDSAEMNDKCKKDGELCSLCCKKQEAHVSKVELEFLVQSYPDKIMGWIDLAMEHGKKDPDKCEDLFFVGNLCRIYPSRFFICRAYMNLFNGESYCPRHDKDEILQGKIVDDITDTFYHCIDRLSEIDEKKYFGQITPTLFFIKKSYENNSQFSKLKQFMTNYSINSKWIKTSYKVDYSVGLLGTPEYSEQYQKNIQNINANLKNK
jgi:Fe-S-cluster containining protein